MGKVIKTIKKYFLGAKQVIRNQVRSHSLRSFAIVLALLFLSIVASNFLFRPKTQTATATPPPKMVATYAIGAVPTVSLGGQVDKSGVTTIVALTPGIIQNVYATEGKTVQKGAWIVTLSNNYQGGSTATLQRQLAQAQYDNVVATFDLQKSLIGGQRDIASASAQNAASLRDITNQSINDTQNLINLNSDILNTLNQNLSAFQASNSAGINNALILSTKELIAQITAGQNQAQMGLRAARFQADSGQAAGQLPQFQKDLTNKQLDLQEKMLDLTREVSRLQLKIAQVGEAMMSPAAPYTATIQKVFVKVGQNVQPGTPLVVISSTATQTAKVTIYTSKEIAERVSKTQESYLHRGNRLVAVTLLYISTEPVQGGLYAISYLVPENETANLGEKGFVTMEVPVGYSQTTAADPFIPIDAVYQTADSAYVYLLQNGKAISRQVTLGSIFGRFVEVAGLVNKDLVILDRSVISGDPVTSL